MGLVGLQALLEETYVWKKVIEILVKVLVVVLRRKNNVRTLPDVTVIFLDLWIQSQKYSWSLYFLCPLNAVVVSR